MISKGKLRLIEHIKKLEMEIYWLTEKIDSRGDCPSSALDIDLDCYHRCSLGIDTRTCWREAAKKVLSHD